MRHPLLSPVALLFALSFALWGCRSEPIPSEWHDRGSDINGKPDLSEFKGLRLKDVNARFVIANDSEQLILAVQTSDEMLQRQLEVGGMTLWLSNPKNKKESCGVRYPAMPKRPEHPGKPLEFMEPNREPHSGNVELLDRAMPERMMTTEAAKLAGIVAETSYESMTAAHSIVIDLAARAPWLHAGDEVLLELTVPEVKPPKAMREDGERRGPPVGGGDDGFGPMGGAGRMRGGQRGGPPKGERPNQSGGKEISVTQVIKLAK
ncbi:MAG: hypothetical protein IPG71_02135 [bacterium]|nr:hypothetical protein [bacterium]